jgi:hypothetical protein
MILNDFNINLALQVVTGDTEVFDKQDENYKNLREFFEKDWSQLSPWSAIKYRL